MAATATISVRIDPNLKKETETILEQLGITPSALITMLYKQICHRNGIPFGLELPTCIKSIDDMTKEEIDAMVEKTIKDSSQGKAISQEELKKMLLEKYGIK